MSHLGLILLFSLPGFVIFTKIFINSLKIEKNISHILIKRNLSLNFSKIIFFIILINTSLVLIGGINNIYYHLNLEIDYAIWSIAFLSIFGYSKIFFFKKFSVKEKKLIFKDYLKINKISFLQIIFVSLIFLYFLSLINRSFIYWNDQDEITLYGYFTRLYAQGWVLSDNIFEEQSRFTETLFSNFFLITDNFFLSRIIRIILFLGLSIIFYCLIFNYCRSKNISLIGVLLFLLIPELSYVGPFSLKVDFMLLNFEILSIFFILLLISNLDYLKNKDPNILFSFIFISLFFSLAAITTKLTSAYLLIVNTFIILLVLFKNDLFKTFLFNRYFVVIIFSFLITLFPQLLYKSITYQNPLYPFPGIWTNFFENPQYSSLWDNPDRFNINIGIPFLNEIYILIYNSLGFSRSFFSNLNEYGFFFHPKDMGGSGWLSPITLIIFICPFYFKKSKDLIHISIIFLILFIFWKSNMQYVRIFLASSTLMIVAFCIILKVTEFKMFLNSLKIFVAIYILIFSLYHFDISIRNNPYFIKMYYDKSKLYEDNVVKSLRRNMWNEYIRNDLKFFLKINEKNNRKHVKKLSKNFFTESEIDNINEKIKDKEKLILVNNISDFENFQTLINYGYIINDKNQIFKKKLKFKNLCIIEKRENNYKNSINDIISKNIILKCLN